MLRRLSLRIAIAVAPLCACAAVLGIDDGTPRASGSDAGAGGEDAGPGVTVLPDGGKVPVGCDGNGGAAADPNHGFLVSRGGYDVTSCGSADAPCKTIQFAIELAHNTPSRPNVYVAVGGYVESLKLRAGVNVIGGWDAANAWARVCDETQTTITAPAGTNVTARAESTGGATLLSTLTLKSEEQAAPGESLYGVIATGSTTSLKMVWVTVLTHAAGAGASGAQGNEGAAPSASCPAGDGGAATTAGDAGLGGDAGVFGPSGYTPTDGVPGATGPAGDNGRAGGKGTCPACVTCGNGGVGANCSGTAVATPNPACGGDGISGCGGGGGAGGAPGKGGGTSVALYAWDSSVELSQCTLIAGDGGNGGAGGPGGSGVPGSPGAAGAPPQHGCPTACGSVLGLACGGTNDAGGNAGGTGGGGGEGAAGGAGGDGAGGSSIAVVVGGNATVANAGAQTLSSGQPGDGGNGAHGISTAILSP